MELNFKDEDKLKAFLESINYNFSVLVIKDASGVRIIDFDKDTEDKLLAYESLEEKVDDLETEIEELQDQIFEMECKE